MLQKADNGVQASEIAILMFSGRLVPANIVLQCNLTASDKNKEVVSRRGEGRRGKGKRERKKNL